MRSLAKKESSRHGFEEHPGSSKQPGAFAKEERGRAIRESSRGATKPAKRATLKKR